MSINLSNWDRQMIMICNPNGGTCLLRLYLPVFAPTKRCEFAPTQKGNFAKKYKWSEFGPTHFFKVAYYLYVERNLLRHIVHSNFFTFGLWIFWWFFENMDWFNVIYLNFLLDINVIVSTVDSGNSKLGFVTNFVY